MGDNGKRATYTTIMRIRVTPEMYDNVLTTAKSLHINPSEFIRFSINKSIKEYDNFKHVSRYRNELSEEINKETQC